MNATQTLRHLAVVLAMGTAIVVPHVAMAKTSTVMNVTQVFGTIDPAKITDYTQYLAAVNLYDGLTTVDSTGKIIPELAESWDVSSDNLTYTFHLRKDATFQDGSPVEAKDVVYTVQRLLAINKGPAYLFATLINPDNVKAVDAHTVTITLNKVYAPFLTTTPLLLVINEDAVKAASKQPWGEDVVGEKSMGAGPYVLSSWQRGSEMVISRYEKYYAGWPTNPIDEVRFVQTNDEATVKALATSGQLGISSTTQANETYDALAKTDGYVVQTTPTATGFYLKLNTKATPTDDVHVRRALQYATDYKTIQTQIMTGDTLAGPLAPVFKDAYLDTLKAPEFDLEKAKEELAKSKYAGKPIKLTLTYVAGLSFEEDIALLMQSNLSQIGVDVDIKPEPWNRITELAAKPETTPAATQVFYGPTYPSPDSVFYVQYHSKSAGTWASMEWLQDAEVDKLIDDARSTTDSAKQNAIYKQIQQAISDKAPDVNLLTKVQKVAFSKCISGYKFVPMQSWDYNFHNLTWTCPAK
ncbi:ABC transporter substrate-binding protein [Agrobacterium vitis]|uniref:ABC transporter substrate-binding protein n=1 Tax=Rhizobium/Agrobacterium group TaxID=227290 RepID=UPI0008FB789D|nr:MULTISPECIES: ABC transporter substrate-binding protein [Rhizobium/Agrobacterium group]MCF1432733.1 ABC transporter substrate-binding protein [Allorhizobium ampelinum]MUO90243.1 ABC transporter substrate-binding protein [Agrobacterium vitis]MUZ51140.1 ABC transporter substrate-binding protein [Agrobacterium vitis]MUZ90533.1 ABC transporter substrate-binding protein [Agrobacterium vitis]MVA38479.1 ABC transporter substrate-binding protein [Agrobacterium vitis]